MTLTELLILNGKNMKINSTSENGMRLLANLMGMDSEFDLMEK